ncbi:MAG: LacI family transcriptional regulator [Thermotogota bacterium]|nr:LacI family transcriptional regulator [Thermotogota bacterium]MDK2864359.1 LacI family transcriptional regulator [Thermotogota bacterium]
MFYGGEALKKKKVTIKDVAKLSGTSPMTVSRVINNHPNVSEETKKRVLNAIEKLGYRPDADARAIRTGKTNRIGIIVSDIRNPFYSEMVGHIEDVANEKKMFITFSDTSRDVDTEKRVFEEMIHMGVDALIIAPEGFEIEHLSRYADRTFILSFGVHLPDLPIAEVWIDEEAGARQAGEYLKSRGVKKVELLMGNPRKFTTLARISGFMKGFGRIERLRHFRVEYGETYRYVKEVEELPEAFFCYNDLMAAGVIKALKEKGITPGKDVLVMGYDDAYIADILELTTVKIPIRKMVEIAFEMIEKNKKEKIRVEPQLMVRKTA